MFFLKRTILVETAPQLAFQWQLLQTTGLWPNSTFHFKPPVEISTHALRLLLLAGRGQPDVGAAWSPLLPMVEAAVEARVISKVTPRCRFGLENVGFSITNREIYRCVMGMFQWLQHQLDVIMYGVGVK